MPSLSLSQAYRITPRAPDVATRSPAPQPPLAAAEREARRRREGDAGRDASDLERDSVRRSPLLRALLRALQLSVSAVHDDVLERTLITFARALNLASGDAEATPQPTRARAGDAAQRRARHEAQLLVAFAELQHAAGQPAAPTREALQAQLEAFLRALARELHVDDDRAGDATQPGSLISVLA